MIPAQDAIDTREMRIEILKMGFGAKSLGGHFGGSLSVVEILAALYGGVMTFDPANPGDERRDRFIFSKGHGVMAQYAALKQLGLLTEDQLLSYKKTDSVVSAHPAMNPEMGIEFSSGSLGQGLSQGVGVALALRLKGNDSSRVFVLLGDGECDEGSIWEAAMSAASYRLGNLVAIVDKNGLQYDGGTEEVLAIDDLPAKWRAFGWESADVDGHDVAALVAALGAKSGRPLAVIAHTVKGKGVSFMENAAQWHHAILTQKLYDQAMDELNGLCAGTEAHD